MPIDDPKQQPRRFISVRYHGPTDTKGGRYRVREYTTGKSYYVPFNPLYRNATEQFTATGEYCYLFEDGGLTFFERV